MENLIRTKGNEKDDSRQKLKWANHFPSRSICPRLKLGVFVHLAVVYRKQNFNRKRHTTTHIFVSVVSFSFQFIRRFIEKESGTSNCYMISYWHHFTNFNAYPIKNSFVFFLCPLIFLIAYRLASVVGTRVLVRGLPIWEMSSEISSVLRRDASTIGNMAFDVIGFEIYVFLSVINFASTKTHFISFVCPYRLCHLVPACAYLAQRFCSWHIFY